MRRTGKAKDSVWRWQASYLEDGVAGLWRDKTRQSRIQRLAGELIDRVVDSTLEQTQGEETDRTVRDMAAEIGI